MAEVAPPSASLSELEAHLRARSDKARHHARKNDGAATLCYWLALLGSFAAGSFAALAEVPKGVLAGVTSVPGAALLVTNVFAFEKKCRWHRRRKLGYDDLLLKLKFENADVVSLSKELRAFEARIDQEYPRFGSLTAGREGEQGPTP